jgi:thiosulfate/3-mercaptopyruvate sulfurtransferase
MVNMKIILTAVITLFLSNLAIVTTGQTSEPWTSKDLIEPAALANMITSPSGQLPVIFNVGPVGDIKGAIHIGSVANKAGLDKLTKALAGVSKDKMVVIYCGCCPFRNCPNIRPAFSLLKEQGFKEPRLLNLKQNLKVDWTDYGYPMN